jgi:thioredoxin-related protein
MKIDISKLKKVAIPVLGVVILLAVAGLLYYLDQNKKSTISQEDSSAKVIDFINTNLLKGQATATLKEATEESGVYKILFTVEGQDYTFYNSKDGKLLFTSGGPMPEETTEQETSETSDIPKTDKSQALLFVMSYCPYGNQAEAAMKPVVDLLGNKADIQLHYVIYSNYQGGGSKYCLDKDNKYCSMHGIQELNQDVREMCVQKYQQDKLWSFIEAVNSGCTSANVDSCWEAVAKSVGIDTAKIKTCQKNEALTLLEQEVQLAKKYGVSGSPQLVINDKEYSGARSAAGYKAAICAGFNSAPSECSQEVQGDTTTAPAGECQ